MTHKSVKYTKTYIYILKSVLYNIKLKYIRNIEMILPVSPVHLPIQ